VILINQRAWPFRLIKAFGHHYLQVLIITGEK